MHFDFRLEDGEGKVRRRAIAKPFVFSHAAEKDPLGQGGGLVFVQEALLKFLEFLLGFSGEEVEVFVAVIEAVKPAVAR